MSKTAPDGIYVYQPHSPQKRKDGRLWQIGGLPDGLTKDEAEAVAEAINDICWMMSDCPACGHHLRFASDFCPQCSTKAPPPWQTGKDPA